MSIFDRYKILHGLPKVGQKITFVRTTPSWFINVEEDSKKLIPGQQYTVRKTELNSSSTYVWLEEFPNIYDPDDGRDQPFFNMSSFTWDLPEIELDELIGFNVSDLRTLSRVYGWGVTVKFKPIIKGSPMLMVDHDEFNRIDAVWFKNE